MSGTEYGQAFTLWRDTAAGPWRDYSRHAFVEGLHDGTLPRNVFLNYLRQDYVFLFHFARAWALAAAKAETLEEMKTAAATIHALVHHEMQLHIETCAGEGISQTELEATPEAAENLAYTRYVLDAGYSGDFLDLMAALAPCVLGYGEIGARLAADAGQTPYRGWIDTYAGEEYQDVCRGVGQLIDRSLKRRLGSGWSALPRWQQLCHRFEVATRLEVGFWDMSLKGT